MSSRNVGRDNLLHFIFRVGDTTCRAAPTTAGRLNLFTQSAWCINYSASQTVFSFGLYVMPLDSQGTRLLVAIVPTLFI